MGNMGGMGNKVVSRPMSNMGNKRARQLFNENPRRKLPYIQDEVPKDRELQKGGGMGMGDKGGMGNMGGMGNKVVSRPMSNMGNKRARQLFNENPRQKLPYIQDEVPQAPTLPSLYSINPSLSTHDWEKFSFDDFWEVLECANVPANSRPIHDISTWEYVRQAYEDIVGHERSSIQKAWSEIDAVDKKPSLAEESTFLYVDFVPGKGRGILAS